MNRRDALKLVAAGAAGLGLNDAALAFPFGSTKKRELTAPQDAFLEDLTQAGCRYFWEEASDKTGQVRDRAMAQIPSSHGKESRRVSSVAATGFGLTALCIADWRGYLPRNDIRLRVLHTLQYHWEQMPQEHGFFYHYNDMETGTRAFKCELSSIDTCIFLCGALMAREYFKNTSGLGPQIAELATKIYDRVDFPWMLNKETQFSMGWTPEFGFLAVRWQHYCELMMLVLLAIGSNTHPIDGVYWQYFRRPIASYSGIRYISGPDPLFTHQFSHAWFDFRNLRDKFANYFDNSISATRAHRAFCLSMKQWYNDDYWGVSASDSQRGYQAWGGPPALGHIDGSVVPCATAGSVAFLPQECLRVLMSLRERYGKDAWGRYGFTDALRPSARWFNDDVLGIDQGIGVLMAENLRTEMIWATFMQADEIRLAITKSGLHTQ